MPVSVVHSSIVKQGSDPPLHNNNGIRLNSKHSNLVRLTHLLYTNQRCLLWKLPKKQLCSSRCRNFGEILWRWYCCFTVIVGQFLADQQFTQFFRMTFRIRSFSVRKWTHWRKSLSALYQSVLSSVEKGKETKNKKKQEKRPSTFNYYQVSSVDSLSITPIMRFSALLTVSVLAAASAVKAQEQEIVNDEASTHRYGRFDKTKPASTSTETGTHRYGRFDKTAPATTETSTGTHKYGRFDKTAPATTETSTGTHKYGRFDKTAPASTSEETGTHRYGRFDKTAPASTSSETGTHRYGRFDKTAASTAVNREASANGAANVYNVGVGSALVAGLALLL